MYSLNYVAILDWLSKHAFSVLCEERRALFHVSQ